MPDLLFHQYIEVLNRVIRGNRGRLYGRVMRLGERLLSGQTINVGMYRDDRANPEHWYAIVLSGGRIEIVENSKDPHARMDLKVKESYLEEVVENSDVYVAQPFKLVLDRLKSRIGFE